MSNPVDIIPPRPFSGIGRSPLPDPFTLQSQQGRGRERRRIVTQVILLLLTVFTTTLAGGGVTQDALGNLQFQLGQGLSYSLTLLAILMAHEMGHYFAARYYRVKATLPYFIPSPGGPFGTFGAVIRMSGAIPNRRALFDIGLLGPLAGVVIAIPATLWGIHLSQVVDVSTLPGNTTYFGGSLLFSALTWLIHGKIPAGHDLMLHPVAFAGWAGLFVTALNLLPVGQLDGGHAVYALAPKRSRRIYFAVYFLLLLSSLLLKNGLTLFLVLILFLGGLKHPPTLDDNQPLGRTRTILGIVAIIFFILTFPPTPIKLG